MSTGEFTQQQMLHRLPQARVVDRIPYLCALARGRSTVHIGFVDAGCRNVQEQAGTWLHGHLARVTDRLVGIDLDADGVADARSRGFEAHTADCRDPAALRALGLAKAEVVLAGEVIEHLDDPGSFLEGVHELVAPDGVLVLSTPNAYGLLNVAASLAGFEVNHPDHVVMFTWRTLTALLARHGWDTVGTATYVPAVKELAAPGARARALVLAARTVLGLERLLGRLGAPFGADGLIVVARPVTGRPR
ncbi:MAG: class I SAM-dependent methyltransferase [Acidimicrobiales bacterium]|nr:class I SAM-dependent methyltransferase [Acidimicrobiales bacterium]